jgi:hypothetical protein
MEVTLFFPPSPQRAAAAVDTLLAYTGLEMMVDQVVVVDIKEMITARPLVGQAQLVKEMMEVLDIIGVHQ